jgi:hypothetical protein
MLTSMKECVPQEYQVFEERSIQISIVTNGTNMHHSHLVCVVDITIESTRYSR